ncbi:MAG: MBL fold metallo-hydrolase [Clostridiales bacterium]|nr:MBL fold metallo-hydrolase [Clostridiales bacterium]
MKIKWLGHSCFLITSSTGVRILTDPFDETVGYKVPEAEADIVTTSHDHFDHNYVKAVKGEYVHINTSGRHNVKGIEILGVDTFHDEAGGSKRGSNVVFTYLVDGMKICHLGDLGHILTEEQLNQIGRVDILLLPVGGTFTIDYREASELAGKMNPRLIIPMHFKTPVMSFNIDGVDKFVAGKDSVESIDENELEITPGSFDTLARIVVLNYE